MPWEVKSSADMPTRFVGKPGMRTALPGIAWALRAAWTLVMSIVVGVIYTLGMPSSLASVAGFVLRYHVVKESVLEVPDKIIEVRGVPVP